ncbi:NmrA family NAD(P)-binding protein [Clostridium cellulovorans]|uniref:NmrA family protein n=1 Tax=Clostridium cellulovorans (strain ATCC 35296 / DSM 3052 / OCM 3 / 743B) TaxID=573061 RepID=D9SKZ3_CLOC7|nr:NmrA family NAD(P)-binding protein [Clostridium cellulovorans]ADL53565.1 NmrA family protein [Clostridium cellulovorans 743B]
MYDTILVTGATSNIGSEVLRLLSMDEVEVRGATDDLREARKVLPKGIELVRFDFKEKDTYEKALEGVKKVLIIAPPEDIDVKEHVFPFIDKAKQMGVLQIIFISILGIDKNPLAQHRRIEKYLKEIEVPYTIIRPSYFMQKLNTMYRHEIKVQGKIMIPAGKAKINFIDVRDVAAFTARVICEENEHFNMIYKVTGKEAITYHEAAEIFSNTAGKNVEYVNPKIKEFKQLMVKKGLEGEKLKRITRLCITSRLGIGRKVTNDFKKVMGTDPKSFEHYINDYKNMWK